MTDLNSNLEMILTEIRSVVGGVDDAAAEVVAAVRRLRSENASLRD